MSLFPALHRRPLPTRFGVTLRTTRVLLPQRRILPRTSDGQWNVLHLSAQLFRLSLRECRRFAGVQRRSVVSERRNVLPAIERRFFVRLPAGIQRAPMCRQHGRLSASVSVSERRHLHRRSQQFYLHLQRVSRTEMRNENQSVSTGAVPKRSNLFRSVRQLRLPMRRRIQRQQLPTRNGFQDVGSRRSSSGGRYGQLRAGFLPERWNLHQ